MIRVLGRKVTFTGKHYQWLIKEAKAVGLNPQHYFTGLLWEHIMTQARSGVFLRGK